MKTVLALVVGVLCAVAWAQDGAAVLPGNGEKAVEAAAERRKAAEAEAQADYEAAVEKANAARLKARAEALQQYIAELREIQKDLEKQAARSGTRQFHDRLMAQVKQVQELIDDAEKQAAKGAWQGPGEPVQGGQPAVSFFGAKVNAHHVVFVIDGSGSMIDALDRVKQEVMKSVATLGPTQTFHVVFFDHALKSESPTKRLIEATREQKMDAAGYIQTVRAESRTADTSPVDALKRAFAVLKDADPKRAGKQIFLVTDGELAVTRKDLLKSIAELNSRKDVRIDTFHCGRRSKAPDAEDSAESVLKAIAEAHGGEFVQVGR